MNLTAEQIDANTQDIDCPVEQVTAMKALFAEQDQSHLYPINGKFNATEMAFSQVEQLEECNGALYGLEFAYAVETALSEIVNEAQ